MHVLEKAFVADVWFTLPTTPRDLQIDVNATTSKTSHTVNTEQRVSQSNARSFYHVSV